MDKSISKNSDTLNILLQRYLFSELIDALKIIKSDIQRNDKVWNWSQTKLRRNEYWILRSIVEREGYLKTKQVLEYLERIR